MNNSDTQIVVRRQRRGDKNAKHAGAWKVAFADFTLAMMAFFMVMWLMQVSSKQERSQLAHYMRTHSVFDGSPNFFEPQNSPYPVDLGGSPSIIDNEAANRLPPDNPLPGMSEYLSIPKGERDPAAGQGKQLNSVIDGTFATAEELSLLLQNFQEIAQTKHAQTNLLVEVIPSGLRVIIKDDRHHQMFPRGEVEMTPFFEDLLFSLGPVFKKVRNQVIISGHTDITSYNSSAYSNWELSAARALQARRLLEAGGMPSERVEQVNAFASTRLLNTEDKTGSENRRVELLILTPKAEKQLNALFSSIAPESKPAPAVVDAADKAEANQPVTRMSEMQQ
ncbi:MULTISPECIES: flagellar motor protein MotB [Shewanella]|uniref:flagellar motor protein MotB n=1 Tax=Shewanella TaxID=22 RepID=UPI00199D3C7E|nr:flagellar motor protein MotB [Shewanella fodinae]MCL2908018.1 OmpA family protein [Shewanella fodinae]GGZ12660.1 chemotaxis protein LafU [Shewanella fodinae]